MGSTRQLQPRSRDRAVPPPPALKCASFTTGSPGKSRPVLFIDFSTTSFCSFQIFYQENATCPESEMNSECCFYKELLPSPVPTPAALPEHSPGHTWLAPVYPPLPPAWGASTTTTTPHWARPAQGGCRFSESVPRRHRGWRWGRGGWGRAAPAPCSEPGPRPLDPQPWEPTGSGPYFSSPLPHPVLLAHPLPPTPTPLTLVWTPALDPLPSLGLLCPTFCLQVYALTPPLQVACAAPHWKPCAQVGQWRGTWVTNPQTKAPAGLASC